MSNLVTSRRAARDAAFQAAYQCLVGRVPINAACDDVLSRAEYSDEMATFVRELAEGIATKPSERDEKFRWHLKPGWDSDRLATSECIVLRMAVYELYEREDIPPKVTITEAVHLAKKYGDGESGKFVNGVLASVYREWESEGQGSRVVGQTEPEPTRTDADEFARDESLSDPTEPPNSQASEPSWTIKSDD